MTSLALETKQKQLQIIWVFAGNLRTALDSATWLNTTRELRQLGWKIELVTQGKPTRQKIDGTDVVCLSSPDYYLLRQIVFHIHLIWFLLSRWTKIDLILFNQPSAPWLFPLKLLRWFTFRKTPKFVLDTRTVPMEDTKTATVRDRLRATFYIWTNRLANHLADGQTAITYRMAVKVGIPPDKLWGVWPSGADVDLFLPVIKQRSWPAAGSPITLTYIGVLHYERNLMNLCKAVEKANQAGMKFRVLLVGNGTEKAELEQFARRTEGVIQVLEPVPHSEIPEVLSKAHVGVLPFPDDEKYRVSSPIKLFEYMASGLAIMATRIVCHTDVIREGGYCFWCEQSTVDGLYSTLEDIWFNQSQLRQMGVESARAAQNWTWNETARKLSQALINGLLNEASQKHQSYPKQTTVRRR